MRKDATHTSSSRENQYYLLGRTRARCCDVTPLMRHTTYVGKVLFCSVAHMWPLLTKQILELLSLIDCNFQRWCLLLILSLKNYLSNLITISSNYLYNPHDFKHRV